MSFKTKRWATWRTVTMSDFIPGIKAYQTPGEAGINTKGWAFPFRGKIIVTAYAADDTPIWAIYDALTDTVDGPYGVTSGEVWSRHSVTHGWNTTMVNWGDTRLLGVPRSIGYYYGRSRFYGWDEGLNFHDPSFYAGDRNTGYMSESGLGWDGSEPCTLSYQWKSGTPQTLHALVKHTINGASVDRAGTFWFSSLWGSTQRQMKKMGSYYTWRHSDGMALYTSPPESEDSPYVVLGTFGVNFTAQDVGSKGFLPNPLGGEPIAWSAVEEEQFWSSTGALLSEVERPYETTWEYRCLQDGGYTVDEGDLDGILHEASSPAHPGTDVITMCRNGWYIGLDSTDGPTAFTVYALDPRQPHPGRPSGRRAFSAAAAFLGDYAVTDDLYLEHVLPFPDERDPVGTSIPPQDRQDGYIIGNREVFQRRGNGIVFKRSMKLKFDYSFGEDWWWPGENPDHTLDTTLDFFAGARTVMGRYPDYVWGRLNPLGGDVSRGIGVPIENLDAQEPNPVYTVKNNQVLSGTQSWVTPGATGYAILRGSLSDPRLCYHEVYANVGSQPQWNARGGLLVGDSWETLVNFETIDLPPLGQDGWTVFGLCPIPKCRSLPRGGWLVNAELYFAPWDTWEWDPGPRDLTFRDTGQGWVPAKWGYIGPLEIEDWHPRYLTGYDEWTRGRSDYGPAALIVFDYDGEFVECLNTSDMYPPRAGSEIAVLPGGVPRLLYRVKGGGTYSDSAEGWGCYVNNTGEADAQCPLLAIYELEDGGKIVPGAGPFKGFVNTGAMLHYEQKDAGWRWTALRAANDYQYPKNLWSPYPRAKVREAIGGSGITLLTPTDIGARTGQQRRATR